MSNNQCLGPNAACIGGLCACTEGYLSSSNNTRCRREMSWFVSFPLLGDRCMGFLSSCYNYDEQECKNERCVCKEGYRPLLEVERKLRHKEFSQCVKNDTLPGNIIGFCLKVFFESLMMQWFPFKFSCSIQLKDIFFLNRCFQGKYTLYGYDCIGLFRPLLLGRKKK